MKHVLAYGMTVQSDFRPLAEREWLVYCVQCHWESDPTRDFDGVAALARKLRSHPCPFKYEFPDNRKARGWK